MLKCRMILIEIFIILPFIFQEENKEISVHKVQREKPDLKVNKGPKGEPNWLGAYGERYSNSNQSFNVTANTETIVPLFSKLVKQYL